MKETSKTSKKIIDLNDAVKLLIKLSTFTPLSHPTRKRIIELCSEKPRTISELQRILKFRYSAIWNHIKILEKSGFVELKQDMHSRGKSIKVYTKKIKKLQKEKLESAEEMLKGFKIK